MALFLAYRIMDGKLTFAQVPARLKDDVKQILTECGYASLAE